jgi:hypothetical protein
MTDYKSERTNINKYFTYNRLQEEIAGENVLPR